MTKAVYIFLLFLIFSATFGAESLKKYTGVTDIHTVLKVQHSTLKKPETKAELNNLTYKFKASFKKKAKGIGPVIYQICCSSPSPLNIITREYTLHAQTSFLFGPFFGHNKRGPPFKV